MAPVDLAYRLKSHAYRMFANNLMWEYNDQIEAWKLHIDSLADAQQKAKDDQVEVLNQARDELVRSNERAMLVFEIFTAFTLSWLGSSIEHALAPRFTTRTLRIASVKEEEFVNALGARYRAFVPSVEFLQEKRELVNKAFGDIAHEVGNVLSKWGAKSPDHIKFDAPNTNFVYDGIYTWSSFKTGLIVQLYNKQQEAVENFRSIANSIESDVEFGEKLVSKLYRENPRLRSAHVPDSAKEQAGQAMINKTINEKRADWTKKWQYYGSVPPARGSMISVPRHMENEMWCVWLLEEELKAEDPWQEAIDAGAPSGGDPTVGGPSDFIKSRSNLFMTESVLNRLFEMNCPVTWFLGAVGKGPFEYDEWIRLTRKQRVNALNEKLEILRKWAANRKPTTDLRSFGAEPRKLVPIEQYASSAYGSYREK